MSKRGKFDAFREAVNTQTVKFSAENKKYSRLRKNAVSSTRLSSSPLPILGPAKKGEWEIFWIHFFPGKVAKEGILGTGMDTTVVLPVAEEPKLGALMRMLSFSLALNMFMKLILCEGGGPINTALGSCGWCGWCRAAASTAPRRSAWAGVSVS